MKYAKYFGPYRVIVEAKNEAEAEAKVFPKVLGYKDGCGKKEHILAFMASGRDIPVCREF